MKLNKTCSCGQTLTTKNIKNKGRNSLGLWFDCKKCESTSLLRPKDKSILNYLNKIKPKGGNLCLFM
jgi:hypothetical protein